MPGVAIPDGARFTSTARMSSVAFEPGGMDFQGMIVDFNGKEQQFLQVIVNDTDDVTVSAGCNGVGVFAGALDATASHEGTGYQTGATFSADSHDVQVGSQVQTYVSIPSWHSMAVPELNGRFVEVMSQSKLDAVDAASGLTLGTSTGQIYVHRRGDGPRVRDAHRWARALAPRRRPDRDAGATPPRQALHQRVTRSTKLKQRQGSLRRT